MSQSGGKGKVRDRDDIWKYFVWRGLLKPFDFIRSVKERLQLEKRENQNMGYPIIQIWAKEKRASKKD